MPGSDSFAAARRHMVDSQLRPSKVTDERLLAVMGEVPREAFVPPASRSVAYRDEDIELAPGRFMAEPLVLARMLQAAELSDSDVVLDVCSGTGYLAALASRLAGRVVALEPLETLAAQARQALAATGCRNVAVRVGPAEIGAEAEGPFNVILVGGSVDLVPDALRNQLAEGGRLISVMRENGVGEAVLFKRVGDAFARRSLFNANVARLPGFRPQPAFVF